MRRKILLIEGDCSDDGRLENTLAGNGFFCCRVNSLSEAPRVISTTDISLVILALGGGEILSSPSLRVLRDEYPQIPIVATGKKLTQEYLSTVLRAGIHGYITQPTDTFSLLFQLENAFRRVELEQSLHHCQQTLKEKQEDLAEIYQDYASLAYSVSHDLRAPLRHIQGYVDILLEDGSQELTEENRRCLQRLAQASGRLAEQINGLLELSRIGRCEMAPQKIDTQKLFKQVIDQLITSNDDVDFDWHLEALPTLTADLNLLRTVAYNLIDNAIKFSSQMKRKQIRVECESNDQEFLFRVEDNGVGFEPIESSKLFEPLRCFNRDDRPRGIGMGLAIVKRAIARHGGRVWGESNPGEGARFYFTLPRIMENPGERNMINKI